VFDASRIRREVKDVPLFGKLENEKKRQRGEDGSRVF
jgi:hypothetical protein